MKKHLFSVAALILSSSALANSACDHPRDDFDDLYCLNKVYQQADAELNANYKKLVPKLDSSGMTALKNGQLAWIEQRNSACSMHEPGRFLVDLSCATSMTITRAQFLQDRYRECLSSGCLNSKLQ